jgi:hypothetical protein
VRRTISTILISTLGLLVFLLIALKSVDSQIINNVDLVNKALVSKENSDVKHIDLHSDTSAGRVIATDPLILIANTKQSASTQSLIPVSYIKDQLNVFSEGINSNSVVIIPPSVSLNSDTPHDVSISLTGPKQIQLSDPITLSGVLKDLTTGAGIANKSIKFLTGNTFLGQTHTNEDGTFQVRISKTLSAGKYEVTATFNGAHLLPAASTSMTFEILPSTVQVQTVPSIEGIAFTMNGHTFYSGKDGMATVQINQVGNYRLDVLIDQYKNPSQQVQFGRWTSETYQPFRMVQVPDNHVVQVGLTVYHKVGFNFVDLSSFAVAPSRVTSISIRSIQGDVFTLKPGDTPWLPAIRTARRQSGLEPTELLYSVDDVTIDGSNVVNAAQQRFFAKTDDTWQISLLLYSMHITVKDALLRSPVGSSVDILLPNNQTVNYPLSSSGVIDLHGLARGIYHVKLVGVSGLGTSTPVALSRDQVVNLKILTKLDLMLFVSASGTFAMGLIFYGRPWL